MRITADDLSTMHTIDDAQTISEEMAEYEADRRHFDHATVEESSADHADAVRQHYASENAGRLVDLAKWESPILAQMLCDLAAVDPADTEEERRPFMPVAQFLKGAADQLHYQLTYVEERLTKATDWKQSAIQRAAQAVVGGAPSGVVAERKMKAAEARVREMEMEAEAEQLRAMFALAKAGYAEVAAEEWHPRQKKAIPGTKAAQAEEQSLAEAIAAIEAALAG